MPDSRTNSAPGSGAQSPRNRPSRFQRSQIIGLILLAMLLILVAFLRADKHAFFAPGWWRIG